MGGVLDVAVAVHRHLGPGQASAVDDGRVIEFVRNDSTPGPEGGENPKVGLEAGRKDQGRLAVAPGRELIFKGRMDRPVTDDQSR